MSPKYKILLCLSIPAALLIFYSFNSGETRPNLKMKHFHVSKAQKGKTPVNPAENENMVAAILIMPKSYLPALRQFSNSAMAKNITILPAQLESKDGQTTAVYKKNEKGRGRKIQPANTNPGSSDDTNLEVLSEREKRIFMAGMLYFLANLHKNKILH